MKRRMNPINKLFKNRSSGQVIILVIILLASGMLMVTPMVSLLSTMLQKGGNEREQRMKIYADEAAINRVIADLIRGADGVATTYTTTQPHTGGTYSTFTINTSYTAPSITVNSYTPAVTISTPTSGQTKPSTQQDYVDPGVTHPNLATLAPGQAYMVRLYNVKAGTLQMNWAYSPASNSEIQVFAGMPLASNGTQPLPAGFLESSPTERPILDTGKTPSTATNNQTQGVTIDPATDGSGGVYSIVFFNKSNNTTLTTLPFAASGAPTDTWIYVKAQKDYIVTATVGGISVSYYVRQVPGFSEPPNAIWQGNNVLSYTFGTNNVSFISNKVSIYANPSP